ncbi:alpha/beta hydrolase-fold protein [Streptomyces sp. B1866]|uniref:alpha/beta hydrolase n=1 Tax=Streptomyces sp. B1866 TaxID=3075431 RepID=UPI00288DF5BE|nr:alpha/beta hydrolase-fold protein [Streptomyces sp. B1866]MDT3399379.1 alpha/beta hydrolase-fold protein [Streptomyces sp. B1866]
MRRRTLLTASTAATAALTAVGTAPARAAAVGGTVRENVRMPSRVLGTDVLYSVYLPPGYGRGRTRTYPLLFLLHGITGDNTEWLRSGDARRILDTAILRGTVPPVVVIMPDGRRDVTRAPEDQDLTYFMDDADGSFRWAQMFTDELLPYAESRYHAGGAPGLRGVGGLSMGGFGALSAALHAPGLFGSAIGLSVGQRTDDQLVALDMAEYNWRYARAWGADLAGRARLNDRYRYWNPLDTIQRTPADTLARTAYYLDCGAYDPFFEGNAALHIALTRKNVPHRFMSREGAHEWPYWISGLPSALGFFADHLDRT